MVHAGNDGTVHRAVRAWGMYHCGCFGGGVCSCNKRMAERRTACRGSGHVGWAQNLGIQGKEKLQRGLQFRAAIDVLKQRKKERINNK